MYKKLIVLALLIAIACSLFCTPVYALEWMTIRPNLSDEEFFGEWNGYEWTTEPKLNYEHSDGMALVGEMVKAGDYEAAKECYYNWAKNEKEWRMVRVDRSVAGTNLRAENFMYQSYNLVATFPVEKSEEHLVQIDVTGSISGGKNCLKFVALQRNIGDILISGVDGDPDKVPTLQMMIDGVVRRFPAVDDVYISAGAMTESFDAPKIPLRESGSPWDSSSKRGFIYFDISGVSASHIQGAILNLYVSAESDEADKEVVIFKDSNILSDDTWADREKSMYNFNGLPAEDFNWDSPPLVAPLTYTEEVGRFAFLPGMAAEYLQTGDEYYAYNAIRLLLDFFYKHGMRSSSGLSGSTGSPQRGSWYTSLQTGIRVGNIAKTMPTFIQSVYMNSERFVEIMKNVYNMMDYLAQIDDPLNWGTTELRNFAWAAETFDEMAYIDAWYDEITPNLFNRISGNILDDGAFTEASDSYSHIAFGDYMELLPDPDDVNSFGDEYETMLKEFGEWLVNVMSPSGIGPGWGDSPANQNYKSSSALRELQRITSDPHIKFWMTNGNQGTPYPYNSRLYPEKRMAILRTGWEPDDFYMMISNRGGNHAHKDKLAVVVAAYGKFLLSDPGVYSYDDLTGARSYMSSVKGHNTVMINNANQGNETRDGETNTFITGAALDYFEGTFYPAGFSHRRSVFFVKPGYWIVSDVMTPDDTTQDNTYAQLWHSYSWMYKDEETQGGYTKFDDGKNIQVVPVDPEEINSQLKDGFFQVSGGAEERNYLSLEKQGKGVVTFDTVLYPNNYNDETKVRTQRIPLNNSDEGTAMKIIMDRGTWSTNDYYYMSYLPLQALKFADFDCYRYDGKAVHIMQDVNGKPIAASIAGGTKLYWDEIALVEYASDYYIEDMKVEWNAAGIEIEASTGKAGTVGEFCPVKIYAPDKLYWVKVNGRFLDESEYSVEDGYLCLELDLR